MLNIISNYFYIARYYNFEPCGDWFPTKHGTTSKYDSPLVYKWIMKNSSIVDTWNNRQIRRVDKWQNNNV